MIRAQANTRVQNDNGEWVVEGFKTEAPGPRFTPWGPLITAAGHLVLSMAQYLGKEIGIDVPLCDTDSSAFRKPDWMSQEDFFDAVHYICGKFETLNPYEGGQFFEVEDINFALPAPEQDIDRGRFEPLYFLGISPKRYGLANMVAFNGTIDDWVMRKCTSHGASAVSQPPRYDPLADEMTAPEHIAASLVTDPETGRNVRRYGELVHGQMARLMLDLWRAAFYHFAWGAPNCLKTWVRFHPQLRVPQSQQISLTTWEMWELYAAGDNPIPNARPGMFFKILPAPVLRDCFVRKAAENDERSKLNRSLVADAGIELNYNIEAYPKDADGSPTGLYWRDTHEFPSELFEHQEPGFLDLPVKNPSVMTEAEVHGLARTC
jgi:hypothetical protein